MSDPCSSNTEQDHEALVEWLDRHLDSFSAADIPDWQLSRLELAATHPLLGPMSILPRSFFQPAYGLLENRPHWLVEGTS